VDALYARYASETDAGKRTALARDLQLYMLDQMYWNNISGSPFYQVAQPWMKGYRYNAEFEVHYETVWLDR
jgi:ABC-type transport system substrate-binding protein